MIDLLEHLRQLLLVQHIGEVPDSLPLTGETRERLHSQANQLGEAAVVRLCDLLTVAVDDLRQGGDPRLPLELALVKVTRPSADLERESLAYRIEQLEQRSHGMPAPAPRRDGGDPAAAAEPPHRIRAAAARARAAPGRLAAQRAPARRAALDPDRVHLPRGAPVEPRRRRARPSSFPGGAAFHRQLAEEAKNVTLLDEALYEVTGRRLAVAFRGRRA